ncbi:hypothetical protein FIE12Z_10538 [Fusarium flagelliforme]|uniref:Uncharacterized protein n=1 Tax=Fusarium flagelliforme TaxID=2675880 RepID=A0A395MBH0_9HYPO|nr:hypothetical protein FIE12Z_10538 [Fusarium flagelliforme]
MVSSPSIPVDDSSANISNLTGTPSPIMMPSAIISTTSDAAVDTSSGKKRDKSLSFSDLPEELRLDIWETMAPTKQDALMGAWITSDGDDNGVVDHGKVLSPLLQPHVLAGRESCKEALKTWRKAKIATLFMPIRHQSLSALDHLSLNVDAIASLWPEPRMLGGLYSSLQMRHARLHLSPVKTFFVGMSAIVCDPVVSPEAYKELGPMRFKTYTLDDPAFLDLLEKCNAPRKRHMHNGCFLATLQNYWESDERNVELRDTWSDLVNAPRGELLPELKPVVIAVSSMNHIELRAAIDFRTHLQHANVLYSRETACIMEAEFFIPPHLRARMIREYRCDRCWPPML